MDLLKIGTFITEKRKQKGLTQKELAEKLHLSNPKTLIRKSLSLHSVASLWVSSFSCSSFFVYI